VAAVVVATATAAAAAVVIAAAVPANRAGNMCKLVRAVRRAALMVS